MSLRLPMLPRLALAVLVLGLSGCGVENGSLGPETDDSGYRDAKQLENQGRMDEALAAYLKVIAKRGEDSSPESHLDAAGIYLNYVKDPIYAIYHFRKYLELEPNSRQAGAVKGQIDAARREFARTIPGWQPTDSPSAQFAMPDDYDSLRRQNAELKAEIASLSVGQPGNSLITHTSSDANAQPAIQVPPSDANPIKLAPMDQPPIQAVAQTDNADQVPIQDRPATKPTPPPASSGRTYTVVKGDTLFSLARKFYKNPSRWKDISAANGNIRSLTPGTQIRIP